MKSHKNLGVVAGIAVVAVWIGGVVYDQVNLAQTSQIQTEQENETADTNAEHEKAEDRELVDKKRNFEDITDHDVYNLTWQQSKYKESFELEVTDEDKENILVKYALPQMERMSEEDSTKLMSELQVLKRIEVLDVNTEDFYTPEYNWKSIYADSIEKVKKATTFEKIVEFRGTKTSELNKVIEENDNTLIKIETHELTLDETIRLKSDVGMEGNETIINGNTSMEFGIIAENVENCAISNISMQGGFEYGIYIIDSQKILMDNLEIANAEKNALCVIGDSNYINLISSSMHNNKMGGILFNGEITNSIIQGNNTYQNKGAGNMCAGIAILSTLVDDKYNPYYYDASERLDNLLKAPHDNVFVDNYIQENKSSGIYCFGGYSNYIIDNTMEKNEKEGMCLDFGTFGTYVSRNNILRNGNRNQQTDEELEADFILGFGRMEDGSSKAKLPGVSIDNSAYNILLNNNVKNNYGSGIKMVRSGYRNLVFSNIVSDNNRGENDVFHGFGIEMGYAAEADEPDAVLDFTADYENIIARNVIMGDHYAGIYLAEESYCNDLIDNVILDAENFSIENHSVKFNSAVGNKIGRENLDFDNY